MGDHEDTAANHKWPMTIRLHFLGLEKPALHAAAEFLLSEYRRGNGLDLSGVTVVLPGSRAGRRLLEIVVALSEAQRLLLTPPIIETVGSLPEQLYPPQRPFASELVQRMAWAHALRATPVDRLLPVIPDPPDPSEEGRWSELGDAFCRQHVELAAEGMDFREVARRGAQLPDFDETARWHAMAEVQDNYLRLLDEARLWDRQTARLVAIRQGECRTEQHILLIGTVDMNVATRQMLDQVAEQVTALVAASEAWADRFDPHGCLLADKWQAATIPIIAEQVHVVDGPNDQANTVLRCISEYEGRYRADQITIGVPDDRLVPDISRVLVSRGLKARWGPGRPLTETSPCRLLAAIADYLGRGIFRGFATIVRHPDLHSWLADQDVSGDWLTELDDYHAAHLPYRIPRRWLGPADRSTHLQAALRAIAKLVGPLGGEDRPVGQWREPILAVLAQLYRHRPLDREKDRETIAALEAMRDALAAFTPLPESLAPTVSASRAIWMTLEQLDSRQLAAPADPQSIEMLGWLELALDDAPALIVTGLNEGFVPESVSSDLFLPNRMREQLGLLDNARRYARDAYALSSMLANREDLQLIVGRRDHDNDPLVPSRLLFAADSETAARRALAFFQRPAAQRFSSSSAGERPRESGIAVVPRPKPLSAPIACMSVTSFRDYIACPYRFYLRHVLRLSSPDDHSDELDGAAFGSLAHEVLRQFAAGPERDSTDAELIRRVLHDALNQCVAKTYGRDAMAVVFVQVELLRSRLAAFAKQQAEWAAAGWSIEHTEVSLAKEQEAMLIVDGEPIRLTGRIDRIDVNVTTGERAILDYKTGESALRPRDAHQRGDEWIDLQLPLYRRLAAGLGIEGPLELGYILLPKDLQRVEYCFAKWTEDELQEAERRAADIVRAVREEKFWPPTDPPPDFFDEFAGICRDRVGR